MENLQISEGLNIDSVNGLFYSPGDIIMLASDTAPDGFLLCDGSTITQNQYPALYAILGTYYDSALLVCKLPNLRRTFWQFPCSTVGNELAYPVAASNHSHTTTNSTITADNYSTTSHNHNAQIGTSYYNVGLHSHGVPASGNSVNVASTLANRSNGSGQGVNLAIYGHTHSWGSAASNNSVYDYHSHNADFGTACSASNHGHTANLATSSSSDLYVPDNVISMRYYIKW